MKDLILNSVNYEFSGDVGFERMRYVLLPNLSNDSSLEESIHFLKQKFVLFSDFLKDSGFEIGKEVSYLDNNSYSAGLEFKVRNSSSLGEFKSMGRNISLNLNYSEFQRNLLGGQNSQIIPVSSISLNHRDLNEEILYLHDILLDKVSISSDNQDILKIQKIRDFAGESKLQDNFMLDYLK